MNLSRFLPSRFRTKLVLLILAAVLPAVTGTVWWISREAENTLRDEARRRLILAGSELELLIARWEQQVTLALLNLSMQPDIISMDPARQRLVLQAMTKVYREMYLVHTTDLRGMNVARNDNEPLRDYGDRLYVRKALAGGSASREIITSRTTGRIALAISTPIRNEQGIVVGTVSILTAMHSLTSEVGKIRFGKTGHAVLLDANGMILAHPEDHLEGHPASLGSVLPLEQVLREGREFKQFDGIQDGSDYLAHMRKLPNGWQMVVAQSADELLDEVRQFTLHANAIGAVALLVLAGLVWIVGTRVVQPIQELRLGTESLAQGNYQHQIRVPSRDEIGQLARSFNTMATELHRSMEQLKETTAAKERIESEIKIARQIQSGLLPTIFPPFPHRNEFDLHACMEPAREVGGDFYDFFLLDNDRLCFVAGDVSDKGVPAALFMAVTKTLLKANTGVSLAPHEIVARVNRELSRENDAANFVTLFFGILDPLTGEIEFCNAGHLPPLLVRSTEEETGEVSVVPAPRNIAVGIVEDFGFQTTRMRLEPGEMLVIYTDGVTDASNRENQAFGEPRLREALQAKASASVTEVSQSLLAAVHEHSRGCEPTDDVTILAIHYKGSAPALEKEEPRAVAEEALA